MLNDETVARVRAVCGEAGTAWLSALPRRLEILRKRWQLVEIGEPFAGTRVSFVAPVRNADGAALVMKLVPRAEWAVQEAAALGHWDGHGAVRLVAADRELGALLTERAEPGDDLFGLCMADDRAATAEAASVMATLREPVGVPVSDLPDLAAWIAALDPAMVTIRWRELAEAWQRATAIATELLADADRTVLHGDLHHHNILEAGRGARLAVDPKGVIGPAEAEPAALLRNPRGFVLSHSDPLALQSDRIDILAERLGDDPRRTALWGWVLAMIAAAWTFEDGEGDAEVRRWMAIGDPLWRLIRVRQYG